MSVTPSTVTPGGPPEARPSVSTKSQSGRRRLDRFARLVVTGGGMIIIASILAILFVIAAETLPLFHPPRVDAESHQRIGEQPVLRVGEDEYRELGYAVTATGIQFFHTRDGSPYHPTAALDLGTATVTAVSGGAAPDFALALSDGRILPVSVQFSAESTKDRRVVSASVESSTAIETTARPPQLAYAHTPDGPVLAYPENSKTLRITIVRETANLMGDVTREQVQHDATLPIAGSISALVADGRGEAIVAGTDQGELVVINIRDKDSPPSILLHETVVPGNAITALSFLIGDRTLVMGNADGKVSSWQLMQRPAASHMARIWEFDPHPAAVAAIASSLRNKSFVTTDKQGGMALRFGTTGATLLRWEMSAKTPCVALSPKSNGIMAGGADGSVHAWELRNPHPEITWRALFGKLWYEGYSKPEYVWQSTGGTDDFEPKFSLTPLIYGTLKGTFYALLFAIPVALLAALYTAQFMHPSLKQIIKPVVEIMAALPSVVLGFIAGIWLAPAMEKVVPGIIIMPLITGACIILALAIWHRLPTWIRRMRPGLEIFLLIPVVLLGGWLSLRAGAAVEQGLLGGDFRLWLHKSLGFTFDQRNSLVVGFAMGFAVVPIIFTIAEDALASVPNHLKAASLALGATPWQTATRVVLPTASPGIFSAIMIGFGRAVGETMIVLMATGNTPVMNWSVFSGFRALSANIAVELPEAPQGGTLYRVLFLAALLLFAMTFVLNTIAELIRLRLRKRYRVL